MYQQSMVWIRPVIEQHPVDKIFKSTVCTMYYEMSFDTKSPNGQGVVILLPVLVYSVVVLKLYHSSH
jgi:hypothetical protein